MMRAMLARFRVAAVLACLSLDDAFAQTPSIDVLVNTVTAGEQKIPAVALDANENFVVVWEAHRQGSHVGISVFGRRFDSSGTPLGPEFQVASHTTDFRRYPSIAMRSSGEFVVVWQNMAYPGHTSLGTFARLYDAAGNPAGPEFQVAAETLRQFSTSVAMDQSGRFVVAWKGLTAAGQADIWARRFDASGNALDAGFVVNAYTTDQQVRPSVAMDGAGNFVVAWESFTHPDPNANTCYQVRSFARRFDASAIPQGSDIPVSSNATQDQIEPRIALTDAGQFMVVWDSSRCGRSSVFGRVFDSTGTPAGPNIAVDTNTPPFSQDNRLDAFAPTVAADEAGTFVVAWHRLNYRYYNDEEYGYFNQNIRIRRYSSAGNAVDGGTAASTSWHPYWPKLTPSIASRRAGKFIVAWTSFTPVPRHDVFARSPDVIFSDGFEPDGFDHRTLSNWSATETSGGSVSPLAEGVVIPGNPLQLRGLSVYVTGRGGAFVQDDTAFAEPRYRARFYFDPSGFDPGEAIGRLRQRIFVVFSESPLKRLVHVMVRRIGGQYAIGAHVRRDDDTLAKTPFVAITPGFHAIEFDWRKATVAGASDGRFEMWIDGVSVVTVTGLDNDERSAGFVRMGAISIKEGAGGQLRFDEFVSRRLAYTGP